MYLVIDIGNTTQKAAIYNEKDEMLNYIQHDILTCSEIEPLFNEYPIGAAIISSVGAANAPMVALLEQKTNLLKLVPDTKLPMALHYETPQTLGTDRIACAVGAHALCPDHDVLAIQAGTCLVTDFVTAQGEYLGGSIAPGMRMRFQSLHEHTARLPLLEPQELDFFTGDSTQNSILSGVIRGMACEIDGIIQHYQTRYPHVEVFLTGGDTVFLANYIKNRIFAAPKLVLLGLYKILRFNVA